MQEANRPSTHFQCDIPFQDGVNCVLGFSLTRVFPAALIISMSLVPRKYVPTTVSNLKFPRSRCIGFKDKHTKASDIPFERPQKYHQLPRVHETLILYQFQRGCAGRGRRLRNRPDVVAALNTVPDLQPGVEEGPYGGLAVVFAECHHSHAADIQDDLYAGEFGLEFEQF